jgi:hypothetical protein
MMEVHVGKLADPCASRVDHLFRDVDAVNPLGTTCKQLAHDTIA